MTMNPPPIEYFFSSSFGDIPVSPRNFSMKFKVSIKKEHPSLTLGDYLKTVANFVSTDNFSRLKHAILQRFELPSNAIVSFDRIFIRSEKHGAFYHIASVEAFTNVGNIKLAVSSACSDKGRHYLEDEFSILRYLYGKFGLGNIPVLYCFDNHVAVPGKSGEYFSIYLADWFEGYYEWHFTKDPDSGKEKIVVWDTKDGYYLLNDAEANELFRQISCIHTMYYDFETGKQIYLWHHSAGDFIVKCWEGKINVKLTTVRKYGNYLTFIDDIHENSEVALILFFLDLTIRMRLDRIDGTGPPVIADKKFLQPVIVGFLDALKEKSKKGQCCCPFDPDEFIVLMSALNLEELSALFDTLLILYKGEGVVNMPVLVSGFSAHIRELYDTFLSYDNKC